MATEDIVRVHSVTVRGSQIVVNVDRYTFCFIGKPTDAELSCVSSLVHGKRDTRIDAGDQVAKYARVAAAGMGLHQVRLWARQNPTTPLQSLANEEIWLHPDYVRCTPEQRAVNQAALDQLLAGLSQRMKMPGA